MSYRFRFVVMGAALACAVAACSSSPTGPGEDGIEIRGQLWGRVLQGQSNPNGNLAPDFYTDLVAGAVVSTSLDSATATSDASGNFVLKTLTRPASGQRFRLRIAATGYPTYDREGCWGGNAHKIALSWTSNDPIAGTC